MTQAGTKAGTTLSSTEHRFTSPPKNITRQRNAPPIRGETGCPLSEREIRDGLRLLLELVAAKRSLYVKPRDLAYLFGYGLDDPELKLVGKVLYHLIRRGLAVRWNNSRPRRYTLVPKELWRRFVEVESRQGFSFDCERGDSLCSLAGLCPYHVLMGERGVPSKE